MSCVFFFWASSLQPMAAAAPAPVNPHPTVCLRSAWKPDGDAPVCDDCEIAFWFFKRRHHCRACGGVFCHDCTSNSVRMKDPADEYRLTVRKQRVCVRCDKPEDRRYDDWATGVVQAPPEPVSDLHPLSTAPSGSRRGWWGEPVDDDYDDLPARPPTPPGPASRTPLQQPKTPPMQDASMSRLSSSQPKDTPPPPHLLACTYVLSMTVAAAADTSHTPVQAASH